MIINTNNSGDGDIGGKNASDSSFISAAFKMLDSKVPMYEQPTQIGYFQNLLTRDATIEDLKEEISNKDAVIQDLKQQLFNKSEAFAQSQKAVEDVKDASI